MKKFLLVFIPFFSISVLYVLVDIFYFQNIDMKGNWPLYMTLSFFMAVISSLLFVIIDNISPRSIREFLLFSLPANFSWII